MGTLTISGTKLTGRTLKWAIRQFLNHHSKSQAKKAQATAITPRGKQTVAELVGQVSFIRPKERPYKTNNFYSAVMRQEKLDKEVQKIVQGEKAHKSGKAAD